MRSLGPSSKLGRAGTGMRRVDQQLMVDVLMDAKQRALELQRMIEKSESEGDRVALVKALEELEEVIRRNLT